MKLSIRSIALLMILVPMLLPALGLSAWLTSLRVSDARTELESRGERESRYLAHASELALLVADGETLHRLAASNLKGAGAAVATLFLDADGVVLAAAGAAREVDMARQCWRKAALCAGGEQRYLFQREVRASMPVRRDEAVAFSAAGAVDAAPELIGRVLLSFDPLGLASIQRAMLLNSAVITLGALLVAWALAHVVSRRLTVPMHRLSLVVARIRSGELGARTQPTGRGEVRELEEGVNAMADRVEAASAEQNRRVDEATVELSRTLIQIEQRNRELDQALERAEAAGRAKNMFLARMSHELRTPLTTVTGFARMMQQAESPEQRTELYRHVEQGSRTLQALVDDILTFVKLDNDSLRLERREFDLESCIEDTVMMQAPAAHARALALVCHVEPGLPQRVIGDSLRIAQVLGNLISNAIKFTEVGHVTVRASADVHAAGGARLLLEVTDTGIGIAPGNVDWLFQPFAQADESMTRRFGGSGLGLSISLGLARALGGQLSLNGAPGVGTTARVELPLELAPSRGEEGESLPAPARLRVALLCRSDSPHVPVLRDYLSSRFELAGVHDLRMIPVADDAFGTVDLLLALEDTGEPCCDPWLGGATPALRLRPIEVVTDPAQRHVADLMPLPLRRRQLLAACARRAGGPAQVAEGHPAADAPGQPDLELHCLIVEDNELNRHMIAMRLRDFGVTVSEAGGGAEALRLLPGAAPDLVLLDVHMPGMDGVTLARHLRQRHPRLPVYALTANVIGSEEAALAAAGVREVLYKPIDEAKLVEVLRRHARGDEAWDIEARPGIAREEVAAELRRLLRAVEGCVAASDLAGGADAAHQLLGVARMFTHGVLAERCVALETALRDDRIDAAHAALRRLVTLLGPAGA
jgi:two-component system sensor histidine kinase BarA